MAAEHDVHLVADLQPEAAKQLRELAAKIGGNMTTALTQAILLANLLYSEAEKGGKVVVKEGNRQKIIDLPKVDQEVAAQLQAKMYG